MGWCLGKVSGRCVAHREGGNCDLVQRPPLGELSQEGRKVEAPLRCPSLGCGMACQVEGGTVWGWGEPWGIQFEAWCAREGLVSCQSVILWVGQHLI